MENTEIKFCPTLILDQFPTLFNITFDNSTKIKESIIYPKSKLNEYEIKFVKLILQHKIHKEAGYSFKKLSFVVFTRKDVSEERPDVADYYFELRFNRCYQLHRLRILIYADITTIDETTKLRKLTCELHNPDYRDLYVEGYGKLVINEQTNSLTNSSTNESTN